MRFEPERCRGCTKCMRACPTEAIRVRRSLALRLEDRCIDCGDCIKAYPNGAMLPVTDSMTDLSRFDCKVAIPSPALFAQFDPELPLGALFAGLIGCGFDAVESLSPACDAVMAATEMFLSEHRGTRPVISSFCPTVVRLVQVKYPDLVEHLLPLEPPREISALAAKKRLALERGVAPERVGAVYLTPCSSKMVSVASPSGPEPSHLDATVSIAELYQPLSAAIAKARPPDVADSPGGETATGLSWAFLGGLPGTLPAEHSLSVSGVSNVIRIFDDIEKERLRHYDFVECHACPEGCVGGCLTVENPYVARAKTIRRIHLLGLAEAPDRAAIARRYRDGEFRLKARPSELPQRSLDPDISRAIVKMKQRDRLGAHLPGIDCGACGAPSCRAFAEDVVLGEAQMSSCPALWRRKIAKRARELASLASPRRTAKGEKP